MSDIRGPKERHQLNREIGARCKKARPDAGYTQEKFAERINVSSQFVSDMERGVSGLSLLTLIELSNALSVTTDYLLKGITDDTGNQIKIGSRIIALNDREQYLLEQSINTILQAFHVNDPGPVGK